MKNFPFFVLIFIYLILNSLNANPESENSLKTSESNKDEMKDEKVIGGREAFEGECPYQVALLANKRFICGGFFIQPNAVITAAHCVDGATNTEFKIRYSTLQYNSGPTIDVKKVVVHPYYNTRTNDNDIAILILSSVFASDQNAKTIDISRSFDPRPNSLVMVSGWGRYSVSSNDVSNVLKVANLTVVSRRTCSELWFPLTITNHMICAMDPSRSACNGDSGGPLVQNGNIVGIVSFGSRECLHNRLPNVYTRISSYSSWIRTTFNRYS